jgi:hypothetical protein
LIMSSLEGRKSPGLSQGGILEMTSLSQSPRDRILWILANSGGKNGADQIKGTHLDEICNAEPILEELVREGRIKISPGKHGDMVSLMSR